MDMNLHFHRKASEKESAFFRKHGKEEYTVFTVKGSRANIIQKVTDKYIYVKTEKGSKANRIPRSSIRSALSELFFKRVTTLKQLIKLNAYSSALAAIIKAIMIDVCKVVLTKTGGVRLTLRGLRYVFSGVGNRKKDLRIVKQNGGHFVLLNYVLIRNDLSCSWKDHLLELGYGNNCILIDPGEKTIYDAQTKGRTIKPIDIDEYAAFIMRHSEMIYQYMTVDKIGDPVTTKMNTEYLERVVGRRPMPIFHIQNTLDVLQTIVDEEHDVIAIGGSALRSVSHQRKNEAFRAIFERFGDTANFHALGLGSMELLLRYNWFSADASSWLNARRFGTLITMAGTSRLSTHMSSREGLGFNVRILAALEERYNDIQLSNDMLCYS
ncbi:MAG: hypothetical protein ACE3L7_14595 [Candidatus Pristimantibacillus sp.]